MTFEDKIFLESFNFYEKKLVLKDFDKIGKVLKKFPRKNFKRVIKRKKINFRKSLKFCKFKSNSKVENKKILSICSSNNFEIIRENSCNFNNQHNTEKTNLIYSIRVFQALREIYMINLILLSILESPVNINVLVFLAQYLEIKFTDKLF
jgi:hypothetical protein